MSEEQTQQLDADTSLAGAVIEDENIFDLGTDSEDTIEVGSETTTEDANQEVPQSDGDEKEEVTKEDTSRYEHWQSKFDQRDSEAQKLETQNAELMDTISTYDAYIQNSMQNQEQQMNQPQTKQIVVPEKPVKPVNYDPTDAVTDPESDSYIFRESMDQYMMDVSEYSLKMEEKRNADAQTFVEQRQYGEFINGVRGEVLQYGIPNEKVDDFLNSMSRQEGINTKNLATLYMLEKGLMKAVPMTGNTDETQSGWSTPLPVSMQSGEAQSEITEEEAFNLGLMG